MKKVVEIKNKFVVFEGNKPVRVITDIKEIEKIKYQSSLEYQVSQMSYLDLLYAFESTVIEAALGNTYSLKKVVVYRKELAKRGMKF